VPADGTGAANWQNGDFGGSRFYGQLSDKNRLPSNDMAIRILSTIGAAFNSARYLAAIVHVFTAIDGT